MVVFFFYKFYLFIHFIYLFILFYLFIFFFQDLRKRQEEFDQKMNEEARKVRNNN